MSEVRDSILHLEQVETGADGRASAGFVVGSDEPYFADHFPGYAIVPGVVLLGLMEHLAHQWYARHGPGKPLQTQQIRNFRVSVPVLPGECLRIEVGLELRDGGQYLARGCVKTESGERAALATMTLVPKE